MLVKERSNLATTKAVFRMAILTVQTQVELPRSSTWAVRKSVVARNETRKIKVALSGCSG